MAKIPKDLSTSELINMDFASYGSLKVKEKSIEYRDIYCNVLESILDGFFALDSSWNFIYVNQIAEKKLGKSKEELIGNNLLELFPLAKKTFLFDAINKTMLTRSQENLEHHGLVTGKWYQVKTYPTKDGVSVYFQEITERKLMEEKHKELAEIVQSSNDMIISTALDGRIISWNPAAQMIFGYSYEEIKNKSVYDLIPNESYKEINRIRHILLQGKNIKNMQSSQIKRDGTKIEVLLSLFPVFNTDGKIKGFSFIARDITQIKEIEKEISKLDRLNIIGQMAAGISHEIRNPLTTVRGFLQVLSKKYVEDLNFFKIMIDELDRANDIISEFLSIGKNKTSDMSMNNLNAIIQYILPLLTAEAAKNNIEIKFNKSAIPNLLLDEKEIRQLIYNLVGNGIESMPNRGSLEIRTYIEKETVVLSIKDHGTGINDEIKGKIGTPFLTTKEQGTGLGLAVSYSIARRHNANIEFETSRNGTTFYVRFSQRI